MLRDALTITSECELVQYARQHGIKRGPSVRPTTLPTVRKWSDASLCNTTRTLRPGLREHSRLQHQQCTPQNLSRDRSNRSWALRRKLPTFGAARLEAEEFDSHFATWPSSRIWRFSPRGAQDLIRKNARKERKYQHDKKGSGLQWKATWRLFQTNSACVPRICVDIPQFWPPAQNLRLPTGGIHSERSVERPAVPGPLRQKKTLSRQQRRLRCSHSAAP